MCLFMYVQYVHTHNWSISLINQALRRTSRCDEDKQNLSNVNNDVFYVFIVIYIGMGVYRDWETYVHICKYFIVMIIDI